MYCGCFKQLCAAAFGITWCSQCQMIRLVEVIPSAEGDFIYVCDHCARSLFE